MDYSIKYVVCVVKYTTILTNIIIVKNVIFAIFILSYKSLIFQIKYEEEIKVAADRSAKFLQA